MLQCLILKLNLKERGTTAYSNSMTLVADQCLNDKAILFDSQNESKIVL